MSDEAREYFGDARTRESFRQHMLGKQPSWYSPWAHFAATTGIGIGMLGLAIWGIRELLPLELVVVPVVFVLANLGEWHAHRNLLHRRWRPVAILYDRHTPEHHRVYRYGDMRMRSARELRLVLIPAAGVAGIVATAAPAAALVGWLTTPNTGWLFLLTASSYVVGYELTHLAYHLPETSLVYRLPFMRRLREHHARHHDPRLMQKWNFNVTVPLADWMFGTIAPKHLVEELKRRPAAEQSAAAPGAA
jgi:sterol desaturase/sphingolipid hydroxylase (fatty acid hydroxylase superfamily)